ncbi:lithostathine-like [Cheilinus undulatus]|uniref:lithostathine-like n=1 Tax=Cheilinus undulatus TaxID=241271 RepID=UPI001BD4540A|nr:lithostathine-like [Cheilinus undulatus]
MEVEQVNSSIKRCTLKARVHIFLPTLLSDFEAVNKSSTTGVMAHFIHLELLLGMFCLLTLTPVHKGRQSEESEESSEAQPSFGSTEVMKTTVQQKGVHFYSDHKSWIDARKHCQNNSSSLVKIHDQATQDEVKRLLEENIENMEDGAWIGLERFIFGCNPDWMWTSDGSKVGEFKQWHDTHPVDKYNNHCGKIISVKKPEQIFTWLDANCQDKLPFICQDPT